MYLKNFNSLLEHLNKKSKSFNVRVTTRISGETKNCFINDCIKREVNESKLAAHIINTYYATVINVPGLLDKEPNEIKKFIIDKIKL